jgi:orotate phosphoribosyltransferase
VATAGIPLGAILADHLGLPFCYVRPQPKAHGLGNQIEGVVHAGQSVLVIEDLISTGGSSLAAVEALRQTNAQVVGLLSVFTYGFATARERMAAAGVRSRSLASLDDLLQVLETAGQWSAEQRAAVERWRQAPETWSPA